VLKKNGDEVKSSWPL